jgi:hypothetical protein
MKDITSNLPAQPTNCKDWKLPENIQLADPSFHKSAKVDLFWDLVFSLMLSVWTKYQVKITTHWFKHIWVETFDVLRHLH